MTIYIKDVFDDLFGGDKRREISQRTGSIFGAPGQQESQQPYQMSDMESFEGEQPIAGLMSTNPATRATGLFENLPERYVPQMRAAKELAMSEQGDMQEQGFSMLNDINSDIYDNQMLDKRTEAQRFAPHQPSVFAEKMAAMGNPDTRRDALTVMRDQYLNAGTHYQDKEDPNKRININNAGKKFEEGKGAADIKRMNDYSMNIDRTEAGIEEMDFLSSELDVLSNKATGWSTGLGSILKDMPLSDANEWNSIKTGVLAGLGLDKIMSMKAASASGSTGMGALNAQELELLVSYRGKLEQTTNAKQIRSVVNKMQRLISNSRRRMSTRLTNESKWFQSKTGRYDFDTSGTPDLPDNLSPANKEMSLDDLLNKYQ